MKSSQFIPKFFSLLRSGITRQQLVKDMIAGVIVGIVALPLAIAFAIASGVSPDKGLVTAVVAGFIISALGGSRVQIGGPTGAFIVIVYGVVQQHGVGGLIIATLMAGVLLIGMGLGRLGNYLKFVPYPLIVGFTSGIAVIIFSSQIRDLLGLHIDDLPADFIGQWRAYVRYITDLDWPTAVVGLTTVLITLLFPRISKKIPGSIVAILLSTSLVYFLDIPLETIESRYGEIPRTIPAPAIPDIDFVTLKTLIQPAIAIALLGAIESLLSAVVADGMMGGRHRSNMELVAQGTANVFSGLFGGIPATGAIARTATNIKNGGRTPIAGMVHAVMLLLIMVLFGPVAKLIPLACLAGILVVVAWHMGEWRQFFGLMRSNRMDVLVMLTTFFLTVLFDLIIAIEVGMILSSFIFMKRMSEATDIRLATNLVNEEKGTGEVLFEEELSDIPVGVMMYEINGPLFFGASRKFQDVVSNTSPRPNVLILRMRHVPFIDASGIRSLTDICRDMQLKGVLVLLSGANRDVRKELLRAGIYRLVGRHNIHDHIESAINRAKELLLV